MGHRDTATWRQDGNALTLTYDTPYAFETSADDFDDSIGNFARVQITTTAIVLKQLGGDADAGLASLTLIGSSVYLEGARQGETFEQYATPYDGLPHRLFTVTSLDRRLSIEPAEVATGARFGGVLTDSFTLSPQPGGEEGLDILRITGAATALFESSSSEASWTLADRWLTVEHRNARQIRYARLARNEATGEERWLAILRFNGEDRLAFSLNLIVTDPAPRFDAASAARVWLPAAALRQNAQSAPKISLYADGTARRFSPQLGTWSVQPDGRLLIENIDTQTRDFTLLKRRGSEIWVLERRTILNFEGTPLFAGLLLNWYTDLGPAVK
jgi:hypothetical protein